MRKDEKRKGKETVKIIFTCIIAVAIPLLLGLYAYQTKKYTDLVNDITRLEKDQEKLVEENKKLVSEISVLSSAERIEKIATEELGMHKAESEDIVRVEMTGEK